MGVPGPEDVDRALAEMMRVLVPLTGEDWQVPAGSLEWSCWETAVHVAHDLLAYAGQVVAQPSKAYLPIDLTVNAGTGPDGVLEVVTACGGLLSRALAAASPQTRAWHWGATDPGGFAALGVDEILVHTFDITQGLAVDWLPPPSLSTTVLRRLFPGAPDGDPAQVLLWCTGRVALGDRPRLTSWVLKAALD